MQQSKRITVVTVCRNAETELEETILSVITQTYHNIEYIIIDGASTDSSIEIINKYRDRISVFVSEPDNGIFDAMNKGINLASGEWINFMNAGDRFVSESIIEKMANHNFAENVGVVYGETLNDKGTFYMIPFHKNRSKLKPMGICHQSIFVRADLAKRYMFDTSFKIAADYRQIMTIYNEGYKLFDLKLEVSYFAPGGLSSKKRIKQLKEVAMICDATSSFVYYWSLLKIIIKNILQWALNREL